jgi:hypothetical protein
MEVHFAALVRAELSRIDLKIAKQFTPLSDPVLEALAAEMDAFSKLSAAWASYVANSIALAKLSNKIHVLAPEAKVIDAIEEGISSEPRWLSVFVFFESLNRQKQLKEAAIAWISIFAKAQRMRDGELAVRLSETNFDSESLWELHDSFPGGSCSTSDSRSESYKLMELPGSQAARAVEPLKSVGESFAFTILLVGGTISILQTYYFGKCFGLASDYCQVFACGLALKLGIDLLDWLVLQHWSRA